MTYFKYGAIAALVIALFGFGWYGGRLEGSAAVARLQRDQAQITATAVLAERASAQEQAAKDHITEQTHAATILRIDSAPAITTPVLVYAPGALCSALPSPEAKTGGESANTHGGAGEPVDRGRDIRPQIEALKHRLEIIMADYRQEDREWPK